MAHACCIQHVSHIFSLCTFFHKIDLLAISFHPKRLAYLHYTQLGDKESN
jgi:hypothetical protein